jgi:integrase
MARRLDKKLTATEVKALKKPGFHSDGAGLYLRIEQGRRLWVFRYKRQGVSRWLSLGPDRDVSLAQARDAAAVCRQQLLAGVDPMEARQTAKAKRETAVARTFEAVADLYIGAKKAEWKNEKHGKQWRATLEAYVFPLFGSKPVDSITVDHVLDSLTPIWDKKPETASRVRGRIEALLDYAKARGWRTGENPARWKGHLQHSLAARAKIAKVQHHAAVAWADLPNLMAKLGASKGTAAACLRFLTLTAARSGEARGAHWGEIDMAAKVWTIPAERMKAAKQHRVPLSDSALAILRTAYPPEATEKPTSGFVFSGGVAGRPLSDVALAKALRTAGGDGFTVHGQRSAFRDWSAESTAYPREVCESALAHGNRDKVEAAYARTDHFDKRAKLMAAWAAYATGTQRSHADDSNVESIRRAAG